MYAANSVLNIKKTQSLQKMLQEAGLINPKMIDSPVPSNVYSNLNLGEQ